MDSRAECALPPVTVSERAIIRREMGQHFEQDSRL
jgi:hypothetical protein